MISKKKGKKKSKKRAKFEPNSQKSVRKIEIESFYPITEIIGMLNHLIEICDFDYNWTNRSIFPKNMA